MINQFKYLVILGIGFAKQKLEDINQEAIKLLANSFKQKSIHQELKTLRNKVLSLEKHIQPEQQIKYHSQPKLIPPKVTPKITEQIPLQQNVKKAVPFKHHLDDSEIKSILWNQYNESHHHQNTNNDSQHQPQRKLTIDQQPIIPKYLPRNNSQTEIHPLSQRENSARQVTQRSSHHSSQFDSLHNRNSPKFKGEKKKSTQKENKTCGGVGVPKHLRQVQSKIKSQIQYDKEQYKSTNSQKEEEQIINIANSSLNPFNNTPQNKLFQPCQSTHFGSCQVSSAKLQQQQIQIQDLNNITERKAFNLDQIASSFLNSPFMKSQISQRLFGKQESASQSSSSSTFSLFNPNNELKNFFQQLDKQVGNSLSFQF
ncbi:unnamed protein product (macronuclear) [Paramecium tetraurelia]|uniref:Uncharacterized protein n=1 Tax=Paramecium tetraurelia TaxID=5888 RepID=A0C024_PARTE|nr:uncharacterized protein GSPATT00005994001 [Paramecium tetraurelia]CAK64141.1 unnamed protein product [Paramecium tetraurelia]|eukprot:XP_001431539.1 hypothetical protein (macronuclear) [Paramecium tetraurelia strain d4-2]